MAKKKQKKPGRKPINPLKKTKEAIDLYIEKKKKREEIKRKIAEAEEQQRINPFIPPKLLKLKEAENTQSTIAPSDPITNPGNAERKPLDAIARKDEGGDNHTNSNGSANGVTPEKLIHYNVTNGSNNNTSTNHAQEQPSNSTEVADKPIRRKKGEWRSADKIAFDRLEIVRLSRRGWTKSMIAERLGISTNLVYNDIRVVYREIKKEADEELDILRRQKLEELAELKRELWSEWERSKLPFKKNTSESASTSRGSTSKEVDTEEDRCGDPRYLAQIRECILQECDLQGLNPAKEISVTGTMVNWDILAGGIPIDGQASDSVNEEIKKALGVFESLPSPDTQPLLEQPDTIYVEAEIK